MEMSSRLAAPAVGISHQLPTRLNPPLHPSVSSCPSTAALLHCHQQPHCQCPCHPRTPSAPALSLFSPRSLKAGRGCLSCEMSFLSLSPQALCPRPGHPLLETLLALLCPGEGRLLWQPSNTGLQRAPLLQTPHPDTKSWNPSSRESSHTASLALCAVLKVSCLSLPLIRFCVIPSLNTSLINSSVLMSHISQLQTPLLQLKPQMQAPSQPWGGSVLQGWGLSPLSPASPHISLHRGQHPEHTNKSVSRFGTTLSWDGLAAPTPCQSFGPRIGDALSAISSSIKSHPHNY